MPPSKTSRQPRAHRYGRVTLAAAVALSVAVVVPTLLRNTDAGGVEASASTDQPTTSSTVVTQPSDPAAAHMTVADEHRLLVIASDPRLRMNEAYKAANPGNKQLADWLDAQLATFDRIYSGKRPRYIEGYRKLKDAIKPWGA